MPSSAYELPLACPWRDDGAGLFISAGVGRHPERVRPCHEIIVVRRGVLGMHEDGDAFQVAAGEALLLRAGHRHGGTTDYSADLSFYWLHLVPTGTPPRSRVHIPRHVRLARPDIVEGHLRRLLNDREAGLLDPVASGCLIQLILLELARSPVGRGDDSGDALAGRARAWLQAHFRAAVSTCDVAAALGCTGDHLGRVYRRCFGVSIVADLLAWRLEHARWLLLDGGGSIAAIAAQAGFHSDAYLRRCFRRRYGQSPADYRRAHARLHVNTR